jgi:serine/threonine-protein phosphatase 2A activator
MESNVQSDKSQRWLPSLDDLTTHEFAIPSKKINEAHDVSRFLASRAYADIGRFVMQLNHSMCPRRHAAGDKEEIKRWELGSPDVVLAEPIIKLQGLLKKIGSITDEIPPDSGPRRFGNIAFRKWYEVLQQRVSGLLEETLPEDVLQHGSTDVKAKDELTAYLLGAFGSAQRLDFGTGHELSFLAFLGCLWKLGVFSVTKDSVSSISRSIVLGVIEPYINIIRRLILTYTLEPAGSHGVWGLDDHFFLPYIFGSAQYCPPILEADDMPLEGSVKGAPKPADIIKPHVVENERRKNLYFAAVGFIYDVKTGPFWEHSPMLYDISGVPSGWGKINKVRPTSCLRVHMELTCVLRQGMIKMYNAEVLSKFPVVQHFPFGSMFSWEEDPSLADASHSVPDSAQTRVEPITAPSAPGSAAVGSAAGAANTQAPRARPNATSNTTARGMGAPPPPQMATTRAPWATSGEPQRLPNNAPSGAGMPQEFTKAPWAR